MAEAFQAHYLQPRTTAETQPKSNHDHHHGQNPVKIKLQQKPISPQITNQITPIEIKAQNSQNNQNHKMKTLKVNPSLKKHILVLLLYFRRRIILLY